MASDPARLFEIAFELWDLATYKLYVSTTWICWLIPSFREEILSQMRTCGDWRLGKKDVPRLREYCRQSQADVVSKISNKIHQTWEPSFSRALCRGLQMFMKPRMANGPQEDTTAIIAYLIQCLILLRRSFVLLESFPHVLWENEGAMFAICYIWMLPLNLKMHPEVEMQRCLVNSSWICSLIRYHIKPESDLIFCLWDSYCRW